MLSRIRKHRIKLIASNVGPSPTKHGGVNHTAGWRVFATLRAQHFADLRVLDDCADSRFACGIFEASETPLNHKKQAEWFESQLVGNQQVKQQLRQLLWPEVDPGSILYLVRSTSGGQRPHRPHIELWDGVNNAL